jgi:GTP-binding protein
VRTEAYLAMELADVIVLVGDASDGVTPVDRTLGRQLRQTRKPVLLAVNKIDHPKRDTLDLEFSALGFDPVIPISAAHGRGIGALVDEIEKRLPHYVEPEAIAATHPLKLSIVGRPNVGKSSLVNAILEDQRTIVSAVGGTTRDAVDVPYEREGKRYILIDTAGIRPRSRHNSSVEVFSVMRSEKSVERADICALVIDAVDGVTAQDKKIAGLIQEHEKPCVVVMNKVDLIKPPKRLRDFFEALLGQIRSNLFFLNYAPIDILSAHTRENLDRLFRSIEQIQKHSQRAIGTGPLNRLLQEAMEAHPPPLRGTRRFKVLYATQLVEERAVAPPTFLLFVNQPDLLTDDYRRYLESKIREQHGFYGLPIIFKLRARRRAL